MADTINNNYDYAETGSSDEASSDVNTVEAGSPDEASSDANTVETGSPDEASSDANTVETGSSGSVPSNQSFLNDNKVFLGNKEELCKRLEERINTYDTFFTKNYTRMNKSVKKLDSLEQSASTLLNTWNNEWQKHRNDYCAQFTVIAGAQIISLDMYDDIVTMEKRIERCFIRYINSIKQLCRIDRALYVSSTMKESSEELTDAVKEMLLSSLDITVVKDTVIKNLFHDAYPSLEPPTLDDTYLNNEKAQGYEDQLRKDWEKVLESLDNTVERSCQKRSDVVTKYRRFLKRVLDSDSDNLDYLRNMFQHKVHAMCEEAVEACDELCQTRKDALIEDGDLVELVNNQGIATIRSSISMELFMEEKKVIWLLNNTPKYHSKGFASSAKDIEKQFTAFLQLYNKIMKQINDVSTDLRRLICQNKNDREKEEGERRRKVLEEEVQKRDAKNYTWNSQTVVIAFCGIVMLVSIMVFLVYGDTHPELFSFITKIAEFIKTIYDMIPWSL